MTRRRERICHSGPVANIVRHIVRLQTVTAWLVPSYHPHEFSLNLIGRGRPLPLGSLLSVPCPQSAFVDLPYLWGADFCTLSPESAGAAARPPRQSQASPSRLMMRTTFGSLFRPWWRRSWMVSSPSPSAGRIAAYASRRLTPDCAAMASMHSQQAPLRTTASPTTCSTESWPVGNRDPSAGGIGPEQASRLRLSMATDRLGAR